MTSKLKCPFCKEEIVCIPNIAQTRTVGFRCYNIQCKAFNHFMPVFILQALIQAKQDLEIARKALEEIKKHNKAMLSVLGEQIPKESTDTEEYCWWASCRIQDCLKALEQIGHKE